MKRILVISDPAVHSIKKITLGILDKLKGFETEIAVFGDIEPPGIDLIREYKVNRINILKGAAIQNYSPEVYTHALHTLLNNNQFDAVIAGATSTGQDIYPKLSAQFGSGLASGVKDFYFTDDTLIGIKEIYGGKCLADVELLGPKPWFMTVVPGALDALSGNDDNDCEIVEIKIDEYDIRAPIYKITNNPSDRPPLEDAEIVVAVGRGIGDSSRLSILEDLADTLNAALGASLAAVENNYVKKEFLIGQSGTQISPSLYIAVGISGAIQHLAGMRNSKKVLAINTDSSAPLMRMADYAVIGNFHDIVPAMTQQLIAKKKK
jgi:electron transfer flavoprotein alpha subunit